jgi:hypothetical protein
MVKKRTAKGSHLAFIAELTAGLREAAQRRDISAEERGRYARWIEHADALGASLLPESTPAVPQSSADSENAALPAALLRQLSLRPDHLAGQITAVLRSHGGTADLDQVLIGLYRQFNTIQKRRFIQNKLWRMVRKGQIHKAKNTRNMFSLAAAPKYEKRRGRKQR